MTVPTRFPSEIYLLAPAAYQAQLNAKLEARGFGPNTMEIGLSATGNPPATWYHARLPPAEEYWDELDWLIINGTRSWILLRVREDRLGDLLDAIKQGLRNRLTSRFDKAEFRDKNWQTRNRAYVHLTTEPVSYEKALQWLAANSTPTLALQRLK